MSQGQDVDSDIWIVDEPTLSHGPGAETAIFAELKETRRWIRIFISHRFWTVRIGDRHAAEVGMHEDLLRANAAGGGR